MKIRYLAMSGIRTQYSEIQGKGSTDWARPEGSLWNPVWVRSSRYKNLNPTFSPTKVGWNKFKKISRTFSGSLFHILKSSSSGSISDYDGTQYPGMVWWMVGGGGGGDGSNHFTLDSWSLAPSHGALIYYTLYGVLLGLNFGRCKQGHILHITSVAVFKVDWRYF